jgi:hypothetical protein
MCCPARPWAIWGLPVNPVLRLIVKDGLSDYALALVSFLRSPQLDPGASGVPGGW